MTQTYGSHFAKLYVAEGRAEGSRRALRAVVDARRIRLSDEGQARIEACKDPATLERWTARAAVAWAEEEVFAD